MRESIESGRSLTAVQRTERRIVNLGYWDDLRPNRRLFYPRPHGNWRGRMTQFAGYDRAKQDFFEETREKADLADFDKVSDRAADRNDQEHQSPRRRKPARSRSRSSIVYSIQMSWALRKVSIWSLVSNPRRRRRSGFVR